MALLIGLAVLVLDVIAILDILKSGKDLEKKILWIVVILMLPFLGMLIYFLVNKKALA